MRSKIQTSTVKRVVETNNRNKYCFCSIFSLAFTANKHSTPSAPIPHHHSLHVRETKGGDGKGGRNKRRLCVLVESITATQTRWSQGKYGKKNLWIRKTLTSLQFLIMNAHHTYKQQQRYNTVGRQYTVCRRHLHSSCTCTLSLTFTASAFFVLLYNFTVHIESTESRHRHDAHTFVKFILPRE